MLEKDIETLGYRHQRSAPCAETEVSTVDDSFHMIPDSGDTVASTRIPLFTRSPTALPSAVCPARSYKLKRI